MKQYDTIDEAGTVITYRCMDYRACSNCKKGARFEALNIQEEVEQNVIGRSICIDAEGGITTAKLPFVSEPDVRLVPNQNEALKVYRSQVRKLSCQPEDEAAVIESERKLQLGFVDMCRI